MLLEIKDSKSLKYLGGMSGLATYFNYKEPTSGNQSFRRPICHLIWCQDYRLSTLCSVHSKDLYMKTCGTLCYILNVCMLLAVSAEKHGAKNVSHASFEKSWWWKSLWAHIHPTICPSCCCDWVYSESPWGNFFKTASCTLWHLSIMANNTFSTCWPLSSATIKQQVVLIVAVWCT